MAARAYWQGQIRLALVSIPVEIYPATRSGAAISFHQIHEPSGQRIRYEKVAPGVGPVDRDDILKGFEISKGNYVMLEDEEIEAVALESTRTIDIDSFVPRGSIDWIWYDKPHFLAPEDKVGTEAFCVIREAMRANDVVGVARLVLYRRERAVLLEPQDKGIVLWTLRYGDEVREPAADLDMKAKVDRELLTLMKKLVKEETKEWSPSMVQDPVQKRLKALIRGKEKSLRKAAPPRKPAPVKSTGNVINIMDALKKSLAAEGDRGKSR